MQPLAIRTVVAVGAGLVTTLALLWLPVAHAQGPDGYAIYYVAPSCVGVHGPCYTSVQAAVDAADDPGDVVKVAAGTYTGVSGEVVYLDKTLTIRGGYTPADWTTPDPEANPTTLDAQGRGRVFYITGDISPTIEGLRITGGNMKGTVDFSGGGGGGLYVVTASVTLRDSWVFSNVADYGGGIYLFNSAANLVGNTVMSNSADSHGAGLELYYSDATLVGNVVVSNTARIYGGGMEVRGGNATIEGNVFSGNTASGAGGIRLAGGGGILRDLGAATFSGNTVSANSACYGAGLSLVYSTAIVSGNIVSNNVAHLIDSQTARCDYGMGGGVLIDQESDATLINNMIVDNQAAILGSGIYISGSSPRLLHNTIARNSGGDGSGLHIVERFGISSSVSLTNTILVSQTVGITVSAGNTATLEATLWGSGAWANGSDWGGAGTVVTGANNYWGDPLFVDPAAGDYHIGPGSAAIDRGINAGITYDIDGNRRPVGSGYDLGADEWYVWPHSTYLPVVRRR